MAHELALELLTIGRSTAAPTLADLVRVMAAGGLGSIEPVNTDQTDGSGASTRSRLGRYTLHTPQPGMTGHLLLTRAEQPLTEGMPEPALNALARNLSAEDVATLRTGSLALDLRVRGETPALTLLGWAMRVARALADLTGGVVLDPAAQRCLGRSALARLDLAEPGAHVAVHTEVWSGDSRWLHTHGLQKFGRPELELVQVPSPLEEEGAAVLWQVAESLAEGADLHPGQIVEIEGAGNALTLPTTPDADHQALAGRLRLADLAEPGQRQGSSPRGLLGRMALAQAETAAAARDNATAMDIVDRLLAADPDDCAALLLKARIYLQTGETPSALELGQLMEARVVRDYRGPLVVGLTLLHMGRYQEAVLALDRAIERAPEAVESYRARAVAHAHLGNVEQASVDRARASYLAL